MSLLATETSKDFVQVFCLEHMKSEYDARIMLVSTFASCFAIFTPEYRDIVLHSIMLLASDIGKEKFEDGEDFCDLLREKISLHQKEATNEEGAKP